MEMLKKFYCEEDGFGTVELVMLIAALVCIALLFRKQLVQFTTSIMGKVFSQDIADGVDPNNAGAAT